MNLYSRNKELYHLHIVGCEYPDASDDQLLLDIY